MMNFVTAALRRSVPAATLMVAWLAFAPQAHAQGAFAGMAGVWNGGGTITLDSGNKERIRCRATYAVGDGGNGMNQNLRCASDSYQFTLVSAVAFKGGALTGTWTETTRNVSGSIEGRGAPGRFQVQVSGPGFSANLSLTSNGNAQTIQITSDGEMRAVTINLSRG
jgi:hypothetical protein